MLECLACRRPVKEVGLSHQELCEVEYKIILRNIYYFHHIVSEYIHYLQQDLCTARVDNADSCLGRVVVGLEIKVCQWEEGHSCQRIIDNNFEGGGWDYCTIRENESCLSD